MTDLDLLRSVDPANFQASTGARDDLIGKLRVLPDAPESRRRTRRRIAVLVAGGVLSLTGGGLAYAYLAQQPATTALKINCAFDLTEAEFNRDQNFTSVLDTSSGDPVADCASQYVRVTGEAPPLAAYEVGGVYIAVMPAGWKAPSTWRRLPSTFRSDALRLELKQRLEDLVEGPHGTCTSADDAEVYARKQLADLGLTAYTVRRLTQAGWANGETGCAMVWVDEGGKSEVLLQGLEVHDVAIGARPNAHDIATRLHAWIVNDCLPLPRAVQLARKAITDAGFDIHTGQVRAFEDSTARCTRVDLLAAGDNTIVLRGPQP